MQITSFGSAVYVKTENHNFLFGSFSEIHKNITKAGLPFPDVVIISEVISQGGIPQLVPEFLFFGHLFVDKNFDYANSEVTKKLTFIGDSSQCKRVEKIIDISYLGYSSELLHSRLKSEHKFSEALKKESDYFPLKDKNGKILSVKDCTRFLKWKDQKVALDGVVIERLGPVQYKLTTDKESEIITLDLNHTPEPVWQVPEVFGLKNTHQFSLCILGAAEPWFADAASTSYLLSLNGEYYLIDCSPFTHKILEAVGIGIEQIKGIIITHIHDDHSGDLLTFCQAARKIELITAIEVWESIKIKFGAIMDIDDSQIAKYFTFREVHVGTPFYLAGATLDFHYACHSVPTVGLTIRSNSDSITITSDTASKKLLDDMLQKEVISRERYDSLEALVRTGRVIIDCGESIIHGYLDELLLLENTNKILCTHRHDLPQEYKGILTLAEPFHLFELGEPDQNILDTITICKVLQNLDIEDFLTWGSYFSLNKKTVEYPKGTIIIEQGSTDNTYFYIVTCGFLDVMINKEKVDRLQGGSFFGEQIFVNEKKARNATIVASTPVRLIAVPNTYFQAMLNEEDQKLSQKGRDTLRERFLRLWKNREIISRLKIFSNLDTLAKNKLSLHLKRLELPPNTVFIKDGCYTEKNLYLVAKGTLEVKFHKNENPIILKENDVFGEDGDFIKLKKATIKTLEQCILLTITHDDIALLSLDSQQVLQMLKQLSK